VCSWIALQKHTIVFVSFCFFMHLWITIIYRNDRFSTYSWIYFLTWVNCKVHSLQQFFNIFNRVLHIHILCTNSRVEIF